MSTDAALKAYFDEAASWDADRISQQRRVLRWSVAVAAAGWLCATPSPCSRERMRRLSTVRVVMVAKAARHSMTAWPRAMLV